jgi:predicted XRE-type DNA-binding protein
MASAMLQIAISGSPKKTLNTRELNAVAIEKLTVEYAMPSGSHWHKAKRRGEHDQEGYEVGGTNVFEDIGVPNADEHLIKAKLVFKIDTILKRRGLKQTAAAELFGVRQPDVSNMLRGEFRQFSVERLLRFLVALNQDVEIIIKPHRDGRNAPALHVS